MDARLSTQGVTLTLSGAEMLFALRRRLHLPFANISAVEAGVAVEPAWRLLGFSLGTRRFGVFLTRGGLAFLATRDPKRAVTLWLRRGPFRATVMDVADRDRFMLGVLDRIKP